MITAIIQARTGSTRLPRKVMRTIMGYPMITHVIARVLASRRIEQVILATTTNPEDDELAQTVEAMGIKVYRGSETDVLDRYYQAATLYNARAIVRITGDCPLLDPTVIDQTLGLFFSGYYDYVSNFLHRSYPDGLDTEVMTYAALETAWQEAGLPSEREHVTPYLYKHPEKFAQAGLVQAVNLSHYRWTVDEPADFDFVNAIYQKLYEPDKIFGMMAIHNLLQREPDLLTINPDIPTNEGYTKSLQADSKDRMVVSVHTLQQLIFECKNYLSSIKSYSELFLRHLDGQMNLSETQQREFLQVIKRQAHTTDRLIQDQVELLRLENDHLNYHPQEVTPHKLLETLANTLEERAMEQGRNLSIRAKASQNLPLLYVDRLPVVLERLGDNALKFTPNRGEITLGAKLMADGQHLVLSVSDTGVGIPADHHNRIFEPFFVGTDYHGSRVTTEKGNGLSLAIAKGYVNRMGGRIWFESEPNKGTTFYVELPLASDSQLSSIAEEAEYETSPSKHKRTTRPLPVLFNPPIFYDEIREFIHDALMPLTAVRGYTDLLIREMDGKMPLTPEEKRKFLQVVKTNSTTLAAYIMNMGEIVRFEKNPVLELTPLQTRDVMHKFFHDLTERGEARRRGLNVVLEVEEGLPALWGDQDRIHRIVQRLVDNAVAYTPAGGQITLGAQSNPDQKAIILRVADTGVGIQPDDYDKIFKRYRRGATPDHLGDVPGSGMGLSIAEMYTQAHGGKIWFESEVDQGTTFYVQLPIYAL